MKLKLLWLLLIPLACHTQPEFSWSQNFDFSVSKRKFQSFVGKTSDDKMLILSGRNASLTSAPVYTLEWLNMASMEIEMTGQLAIPNLSKETSDFIQFELIDKKIVVLFNQFVKTKMMNYLTVMIYGLNGDLMFPARYVDSIKVNTINRLGGFNITKNSSNTHILIQKEEPFEKKAIQNLSYKVINSKAEIVIANELELPFKSRGFDETQTVLDESLNAFFLVKVTDQFKKWTQGDPNYKYVLLELSQQSTEIKEYEIQLGKRSISDIAFRVDDNILQLVGLYSDEAKTEDESSGSFYIKIDTEAREILSTALSAFPNTLYNYFLNETKIAKGREIKHLTIKRLLPKENGATILLEQFIFREVCNVDVRTGLVTCQDNYYYNDLVFLSINQTGKLTDYKVINKAQYSSNVDDAALSAFALTDGKKDVALFYDNPKNLKLPNRDKVRTYESKMKSDYLVANVGNKTPINYSALDLQLDKRQKINHQDYFKIDDSAYLFFAQNKKMYRIGMVQLKDEH